MSLPPQPSEVEAHSPEALRRWALTNHWHPSGTTFALLALVEEVRGLRHAVEASLVPPDVRDSPNVSESEPFDQEATTAELEVDSDADPSAP